MSTAARLRGADFDAMAEQGAFSLLPPMKIELIHGELRFMNPAGPIHDGEIEFLTDWSYENTNRDQIAIRVQCAIVCGDHRPEPDLVWFRKSVSRRMRPNQDDILLLIEIADSSLKPDLGEKAFLYAEHGVVEYWVVDVLGSRLHVHRNPDAGLYRSIEILSGPQCVSPLSEPKAKLSLNALFELDS